MQLTNLQTQPMSKSLTDLLSKPPQDNIIIFRLNLENLVKDEQLIIRASKICNELHAPYRLLLNAIFWDYRRLQAFVTVPSSLAGHHAEPNGNFRHTIEVVEQLSELCATRPYINRDLAVLTALLHDSGKAMEYKTKFDRSLKLSDRGRLLGHKVTAIEWVIEAVSIYNIKLPNNDYMLLLHNLSAVVNAPFWAGLRNPATPEARFLSFADQISGFDDLAKQTSKDQDGWGNYHDHLPAKQIYFS
jgi:3'-5' exoribonuclease